MVEDRQNVQSDRPRRITEIKLFLFALASAAVVANGYYIHPLVTPVAEEFGVSGATIGLIPALNQIALALGILLLLPLGDRINNRKLVTIFVVGQFLAMLAMALSEDFLPFAAASSVLGFFTITPYLLPAYVSQRVRPERIGHVTGIMTAGVTLGILGSRVGGGLLGHYYGWRSAFWVGTALMGLLVILLPLIMERDAKTKSERDVPNYSALLRSLWPIMKSLPEVFLGGVIQALSFGLFLALWLSIGLHLPTIGYGIDTVGYLALVAAINVVLSPHVGKLADRLGPERTRVGFASLQLIGALMLPFFTYALPILIIAIIFNTMGGASIDICSRTIMFSRAPEIRTRLMTIYIVTMFIGGGLASWLGTASYEFGGWSATATLAITLSALVTLLSLWGLRFRRVAKN